MDKFSGDITDEVAALRAEVNELRALIRSRPALTQASQGWRLPDMTVPTVGPGEIHFGSNGGEPFFQTESGTKRLPTLPGAAPTYPGSFSSPATIGSNPTAANYNALRDDIVTHLHGPLRDLIEKGRVTGGSGLWLP